MLELAAETTRRLAAVRRLDPALLDPHADASFDVALGRARELLAPSRVFAEWRGARRERSRGLTIVGARRRSRLGIGVSW